MLTASVGNYAEMPYAEMPVFFVNFILDVAQLRC